MLLYFHSCIILLPFFHLSCGTKWTALNLPQNHIPYLLRADVSLRESCIADDSCPYKKELGESQSVCFGYEEACKPDQRFLDLNPRCPEKSKWKADAEEQLEMFDNTGDFGIVKEKKTKMKTICQPKSNEDSMLECEEHARFCHGKNIVLDLGESRPSRSYDVDFIKAGQISGKCELDRAVIKSWDKSHRNALQSWYQVIEQFSSRADYSETACDVVLDKPTYLIQTDAEVNMFHHFCDFVNLYVTLHVNGSLYNEDVYIMPWDTTGRTYQDPFGAAWRAFSTNPLKSLGHYFGKTVCFRDVVFTLPPRQRFGLFYNMPLIDGCYGTGLFRAFNEHMIHRLKIKQRGPLKDKVRITILSRKSKYRNILNADELLEALNRNPRYEAKIVVYKFVSNHAEKEANFLSQIEETHNSDIFIGMHGAGLTHMLFLPHWAAVMELYHCDDPKCYSTLARLRGVKYFTWTKMDKLFQEDEGHHPTLGAHKKFTNYSFDVDEFLHLVGLAVDHVIRHPEFRAARKQLYKTTRDEL